MKVCLCQSAHKTFEPNYSDGIKQHDCWSALQELTGGRDAYFTCDVNDECVGFHIVSLTMDQPTTECTSFVSTLPTIPVVLSSEGKALQDHTKILAVPMA